jgi:hypothetical protein
MASEVTSSIDVEINLMDLLSLTGIELPQTPTSGSTQELPQKIKLEKITGTVVNVLTNEPLAGVIVTNPLLKRDTTNKKGEFTIKHPAIAGTGLDPTKFPLNFKLKKYSPLTVIPYTSVGDIKSNLGINTLKPVESDLKKEILEFLAFPDSVTETYTTTNVTFDFRVQKKLNTSIDDIKGIVIPLVLSLIAVYGVSKVQELLEKSKLNPQAAFEEIKDLITCPPKDEIDKLIATKNKLVNKINNTLNVIKTTTNALTISEGIILTIDTTYQILKVLPTPSAIGGVGIPISVINGIQDVKTFLSNNIGKFKTINTATLAILTLLELVLSQVLSLLTLLDLLTQFCYPGISQDQISTELTALTQQQSNQLSPVVTNANGFEMGVETEVTDKPLKRRRAIARNKGGVVMLQGEFSYSSIDQILIDELVFYIQQNNLKAE